MTKNILYLGIGLLAFIHGSAVAMKTFAAPEMVAHLNEFHFNSTWRLFIGIIELLGVAGLLLPRTRDLALVCLWPYTPGGLALHISYADSVARIIPAVVAAVLVPITFYFGGFFNLKPKTNE